MSIWLPSDVEVAVRRTFDAPRSLVFDAMTKPELVRRWLLGPDEWVMDVCVMDLRVGGAYRWVWRNVENGTVMGMGGRFLEIDPPARLVATEHFDDAWYPGEAVDTTELTESGGVTTFTMTVRYESQEARDTALKTGMESGMAASYDRLAEMLVDMQS
jgi:uncharacterized protein YndB with AHSA1/START domain